MTGLENFSRLKREILSEYRIHFPYFKGDWKTFSSQDIQNLIELVQTNLRETVSEKWIYTHLKGNGEKLPRKDMLDIFSKFCGYSGWDEFTFEPTANSAKKPRNHVPVYVALAVIIIGGLFILLADDNEPGVHKIKVTDQFTGKPLDTVDIDIFEKDSNGENPVPLTNRSIEVDPGQPKEVVVKSPYYKPKTVTINPSAHTTEIRVTPEDYAMMIKAFMKSDIKDWQTRKAQLEKILADDLEVIVMLKDNLGAESLNKTEFSQKLIIPTPSIRKLKIIEINYADDKKIQFIRMAQE